MWQAQRWDNLLVRFVLGGRSSSTVPQGYQKRPSLAGSSVHEGISVHGDPGMPHKR